MSEARKLNAAEVVFSLDFVTKLVKKVHKDNPQYSVKQIAAALDTVFKAKLDSSTKRLANIEKIKREYSILRSAEPTVKAVVDMLEDAAKLDYVDHVIPVAAKPAKAAKANGKANVEANSDQLSLM